MLGLLNKIRIPTLLGLAVIVMGIGVGIYTVSQRQILTTQAAPDQTPTNITITNLDDKSVSISWQTTASVTGFVSFGVSDLNQVALDDQDSSIPEPRSLHHVTLKNLAPETTYQYKIVSGKLKNLSISKFTTPRSLNSQNGFKPVVGTVLDDRGTLSSGLVFLNIQGAQSGSTVIRSYGNFVIPLNTLRQKDLESIYTPAEGEIASLVIIGEDGKRSQIAFKIKNAEINLPPIKLGQDIDLTNIPEPTTLGISTSKFDLNGDGKLNSSDYALLLKNSGKNPKDKRADLNGDGIVDKKDQNIMSEEIKKANQ